ncbi:MAG: hypothetical protein CMK83_18250 [Pseudomonadales bacterium]|uniref:PilZ domain-containing protein n=1 Tax=unclassified Ketobacter TaxID=2639109 RepID=UPI000C97296A|nr:MULTISPECIES: PilZ domain-containing protein [unclassified Ketobacter]MAQ26150.1 hypothetical protein [Pseudomonadales bacterium]MEC8811581.1 PilZ domain-containing protein [Pseudomonadota bacterium]HAG95414.1 hypothetical protein [Gammaproteobacteria bacterium]RLT91792.1 MAG: hypothetical protein D9N13_00560 [Ketobacter sp. GenoA1]RLT93725.1 MAG: hypothetical protein D9N15_19570 [Ketobacter sp.]|tara:strand:+ start:939 stop:1277 length:339 start_codon:yes stop_codon:yes gene_type:complete
MASQEDRRNAPRSPIQDTLFIESVSSSQISMVEPARANAINASSTGLQVELDFAVLEDAEIALWINGDSGERTLISGIVRWIQSTERESYLVGIELDDASGPAIASWLEGIH